MVVGAYVFNMMGVKDITRVVGGSGTWSPSHCVVTEPLLLPQGALLHRYYLIIGNNNSALAAVVVAHPPLNTRLYYYFSIYSYHQ